MKKVLVLSGDGINCENESAAAFEMAGARATIIHVNSLLQEPEQLLDYSIFCVPGGFSFGDELRSGKILAEKMRETMKDIFQTFTKNGGLTIGICNGFQVLIQLGVFSNSEKRSATLATNSHGRFLDRWVEIEVDPRGASGSPWFKGIHGRLELPMRHKEGRIVLGEGVTADNVRIPLRYSEDVNGSFEKAAALLDETGQILGLMPHPEAALHSFLNPLLSDFKEENARTLKKLFQNAVEWSVS